MCTKQDRCATAVLDKDIAAGTHPFLASMQRLEHQLQGTDATGRQLHDV
jgi:hypothetical protein